ncbi:nucleic acid-binding protein [Colletotrichum incanum]|nr:nucleic acid-binding protein [Colletotrichum incanum]
MSALPIQSFYKKEPPTLPKNAPAVGLPLKDDGFTQAEINAGHNPLDRPWNPSEDYGEVCIGDIQPGPTRIRFTGRIVNYAPALLDYKNTYNRPTHQLIVTDDTGAIGVRLIPIGIPVSLLVIGQLVTVWASWAGTAAGSNHGNIPFVTMYTTINPADVGTKQFIQFLPDTPENQRLCRAPLEYDDHGQQPKLLPGLMTLGQYLKTGHDTRGARIIVCIKSIGACKRIIMQGRTKEAELLEVSVYDDTASCVLTLWEDKANSAKLWKPNETILLLTSPKFLPPRDTQPMHSSARISLNYNTLVDVDPNFQDANWLREWVANRVKKEGVYVPFPKGIWNTEAVHGPVRPLFTLAEVDDFARADPATDFTGKLNLTVLGINLLEFHRRKMMFCIEW